MMCIPRDDVEILEYFNSNFEKVDMIEYLDVEVEEDRNLSKELSMLSSSYVESCIGLQFDNLDTTIDIAFSSGANLWQNGHFFVENGYFP